MKIGIHSAFHTGSVDLSEFAAACEKLGFESLWLPEQVVLPLNPHVVLGGGTGTRNSDWSLLMTDPLIGLTVAAAATSTLRLGTGVSLNPDHHPTDFVRRMFSLDFHSKRRFIIGAGEGWQLGETAALGRDFTRRWMRTSEVVAAMKKRLWVEDVAEHDGEFFKLGPMRFDPRSILGPGPPILISGTLKRIFRRVVEWADGWAPWYASVDAIAAGRKKLDKVCEQAGRDPGTVSITNCSSSVDAEVVSGNKRAGTDRLVITMESTPDHDPFARLEEIAKIAGL